MTVTQQECGWFDDIEFTGYNIAESPSIEVPDAEVCAYYCLITSECKFWSFNKKLYKCDLKNREEIKVVEDLVDWGKPAPFVSSGIKMCGRG